MTRKRLGVLALLVSTVVIFALPAFSLGKPLDLSGARDALVQAGQQVQSDLKTTVDKTGKKVAATVDKTKRSVKQTAATAKTRATATDPPHQPPMHGSNPHGQGNVAIVDLNPKNDRPLDANPDGKASGEDVIAGRARGEKDASGKFHGHITILSLLGNELIDVDSTQGQTSHGPLQGLQTGVLDPLCQGTGGSPNGVCLSLLTADSTTTAAGSTNDFAVARAAVLGLQVGAAESAGNISEDAKCQTSVGSAKTANVKTSSGAIADVANSNSASKSCTGQAPQVANSSQVINLGGNPVGLPNTGCANGTPDTDAGLPGLLPIVCNAEEIVGAAAVREALDVFALQTGTTSLLKETTAASESLSVAPPEGGKTQCSDGIDNDGDGKVDAADPGCHTDGKPDNQKSYDATDNDESDKAGGNAGAGNGGGGGKGGGGNEGAGNGGGGNEGAGNGGPQCSDTVDNDGDGVIDAADPGCHSDGNPKNKASFNPKDNSEGGGGAKGLNAGALPFTGTDVIGIALAGLLMLAGGLMLRRREDVRTVR
jgi:LPXTG-motif cell wall-anchored protein